MVAVFECTLASVCFLGVVVVVWNDAEVFGKTGPDQDGNMLFGLYDHYMGSVLTVRTSAPRYLSAPTHIAMLRVFLCGFASSTCSRMNRHSLLLAPRYSVYLTRGDHSLRADRVCASTLC